MREIKFRAWDGNRFYRFDDSRFVLSYCDVSGWNVHPNITNFKGMWTCGESASNAEHFVLEQYTGLRDKNGVEIYEGDIVEVFDTRDDLHFKGEVVFENCSFAIRGRLVTHYRWMDYEVTHIGNIHENPELLEVVGE